MHVSGGGCQINLVPYTGEAELFGVKLAEGDLKKMRDAHGVRATSESLSLNLN